jgi:predicted transcriptional regulator
MRKDEIEDRIVRLEQDLRTLKADHRDGVNTILSEMQKFQNSVIEERIADLRERVIEGYEKIFMDIMLKNAEQNLDMHCLDPCARDRRKECYELLTARLRVAAQKYQDPDLVLPPGRETISDRALIKQVPFLAGDPCKTCFSAYIHEKDQIKKAVGHLKENRESLATTKKNLFLSDLPGDLVISTLVEPLSHEHRFAMLKALSTGSMTFKELGTLTGSKGGHLLYHINRLIESGLVIKTDGGKFYTITDRGLGVMGLVKDLYAQKT